MTVGIVGLGLIGGSLAKALKLNSSHKILAFDTNAVTLDYAALSSTVDGVLTEKNLCECEYVFIAINPKAAVEYLEQNADKFSKGSIVMDCCGTKRAVCAAGFELAQRHGFTFIGGHPMAGTQYSGFKYSRDNLFKNASMILVAKHAEDISVLERAKSILCEAGFGSVTSAEKHDEIIAYTSQLAHVVSNAYVKSPGAQVHKGFSAGSYKDLTRVARLNEKMWTELFIENGENLANEIDFLIGSLTEYSEAIKARDNERLCALLKDGREKKERAEAQCKPLG